MRVPAWVPISKNVSVNTFSVYFKNNRVQSKLEIIHFSTFSRL
jgi:hypothetical protein